VYYWGLQLLNRVLANHWAEFRNAKWAAFLRTLHLKNAPLWKIVRYFAKWRDPIPTFVLQVNQYYVAEDKADILAQHFETNHRLTTPQTLPHHAREVERLVEVFFKKRGQDLDDPPPITYTETRQLVKKLKPRISSGNDAITNVLIRQFSSTTICHMTGILNALIRFVHFPSNWKHAVILALPKPKKPPNDPGSYRPISLLNNLRKLMENIVAKWVESHAHQEGLLPNEHFGFRKIHSTTAQIARLTVYITHGYNNNKHTGLVMLDVEKAYDTIWVRGLLYTLINFKFPVYLIKFLQSYLTDRSFSVTVSGFFSPKKTYHGRTRTGCSTLTDFFTLYSSDIPWPPSPIYN
jgi:hypothetical protein